MDEGRGYMDGMLKNRRINFYSEEIPPLSPPIDSASLPTNRILESAWIAVKIERAYKHSTCRALPPPPPLPPLISSVATLSEPSRVDNYPAFYT